MCMYFGKSNTRSHQLDVQATNVSISLSTESEIDSLDAGSRIPALDLWDVVIEVLRPSKSTKSPNHGAAGNCSWNHKSEPKSKGNRDVDQLSRVDYVTTNANSSQGESKLYFWRGWSSDPNDHQKERRPTMRHVPRTHRVALIGQLIESIWTPRSKSNISTPKKQRADMLAKGSCTRDEWDHLLPLLKNMNFSMPSCHFLSNRRQSVMSKRAQERTSKEGSAVAKPRPMNLVSRNLPERKENSLRKIRVLRTARESRVGSELCFIERQETGAKQQTQQCIPKSGAKMTLNLLATGNWGGVVNLRVSEHQETGARWWQSNRKDKVGISHNAKSPTLGTLRKSSRTCGQNRISQKRHQYSELKFWRPMYWSGDHLCRQRCKPLFILEQITMKVWNYTGTQTSRNFRICSILRRDWFWTIKPKFWMYLPSWTRSTLAHDQVIKWTKAKVHVYSDSVLCLRKMQEHQQQIKDGKLNSKNCDSLILTENYLELVENQLSSSGIFPRTYFIGDLPEDPKRLAKSKHWSWQFLKDKSSSCECWMTRKFRKMHVEFRTSRELREEILARTLVILRPKRRTKWHGTLSYTLEGKWDSIAAEMVGHLKEIGHPAVEGISALSRGILKKGKWQM